MLKKKKLENGNENAIQFQRKIFHTEVITCFRKISRIGN